MKKQNAFGLTVLMIGALLVLLFTVSGWASGAGNDVHPDLDEQDMYVACADCHEDVTPDVTRQWYDSVHGIAMVKCYQCHGTLETFQITPGKANCATCHADQIDKKMAQKAQCWECHLPHSFKAE